MKTDEMDQAIGRKSAYIYLSITALTALLFLAATQWIGTYSAAERLGGMVWISLLTLIVSMPVVTSNVKKKLKG